MSGGPATTEVQLDGGQTKSTQPSPPGSWKLLGVDSLGGEGQLVDLDRRGW